MMSLIATRVTLVVLQAAGAWGICSYLMVKSVAWDSRDGLINMSSAVSVPRDVYYLLLVQLLEAPGAVSADTPLKMLP